MEGLVCKTFLWLFFEMYYTNHIFLYIFHLESLTAGITPSGLTAGSRRALFLGIWERVCMCGRRFRPFLEADDPIVRCVPHCFVISSCRTILKIPSSVCVFTFSFLLLLVEKIRMGLVVRNIPSLLPAASSVPQSSSRCWEQATFWARNGASIWKVLWWVLLEIKCHIILHRKHMQKLDMILR